MRNPETASLQSRRQQRQADRSSVITTVGEDCGSTPRGIVCARLIARHRNRERSRFPPTSSSPPRRYVTLDPTHCRRSPPIWAISISISIEPTQPRSETALDDERTQAEFPRCRVNAAAVHCPPPPRQTQTPSLSFSSSRIRTSPKCRL